ncbi:zf-PARP-domain-containing protein [Hymenopellis radicata]|nr:zf-PARP-domain-containing protein [Hymenopellis radicata]
MPGYRFEYATSGRAKCKVVHGMLGTTIKKDELRFGTTVEFNGNTSFQWRHWGCVTKKVLSNVKESAPNPEDLDGWEDLKQEDKDKITKAYDEGHVAEEDIPETAKGDKNGEDEDDEDEKPAKKGRATKKKADDGEEKPKKGRATKKVRFIALTLGVFIESTLEG